MTPSIGSHPRYATRFAVADRTVLIVGGGFGQLPAVQTARRLGWRTVVVDRNPAAVAMRHADVAVAVDIVDHGAVLVIARREAIDGCLTLQSDIGVPTVGRVNDALGLVGVTSRVALTCSHKDLARQQWAASGVPQPPFRKVRSMHEARSAAAAIGFPCIAKAADASASRGVVRVDSPHEIDLAFDRAISASRAGVVVIEGFVDGHEFGAQTFSIDGRCEIVLLHDDQISAPPHMVPIGHSYPFSRPGVDPDFLRSTVARAVEALGIRDGPANVDLIVDRAGKPMLLEIGARIGATCLPELTSLHTGIDWVEAALRACVGDLTPPVIAQDIPCASMILEAPADGVVASVDIPAEVRDHAAVREVEVTARPGDRVSRLRVGTDRIGKVITTGPTANDAIAVARWARDRVRLEVT
jgi:biotin carboxylase